MHKLRELYANDNLESLLPYLEVSCIDELRTSSDACLWLSKTNGLPKPSGLYVAAILSLDADGPETAERSPAHQLAALAPRSKVCTLIRLASRSDLYLLSDELMQLFSHLRDMQFLVLQPQVVHYHV
jgi:hypothetical protein